MEWVAQYLRACANCGSSFMNPDTLLCRNCEELCNQDLSWRPLTRNTGAGGIEGASLWDWVPGKNEALSSLLLTMKGGIQRKAYHFYAQRLVQQRQKFAQNTCDGEMIFIPAPPSGHEIHDHAFALSQALSNILGTKTERILAKTTLSHQRELNLDERGRISLKLDENFSRDQAARIIDGKTVVFVDDVVTTGSTAIAAKAILHNCKRFEVLCLAQRETCFGRPFLI